MGCRLLFQPAQGGGEQIGRFQAEHNGVAAFASVITGGEIRNVSGAVEIHGEIEAAHAAIRQQGADVELRGVGGGGQPFVFGDRQHQAGEALQLHVFLGFKHAREQGGGFHCATCSEIRHAEQLVSRCQYPSC